MMETAKMLSLLIREFTIIAGQHREMARHYRIASDTVRRMLDNYPADLLPPPTREEDVATFKEPTLEFGSGSGSAQDYD
jgi:hypothetical protein